MFCKKCKQTIKDGDKFCHSCGTPVETTPRKAFDPASAFKPAGPLDIADNLDTVSTGTYHVAEETYKRHTMSTSQQESTNGDSYSSDKPVSIKGTTHSSSSINKSTHPGRKTTEVIAALQNDMDDLLRDLAGE